MKESDNEVLGLLLTVGGAPDPILFTVRAIRPRRIAFVCSEASMATVTAIKEALNAEPETIDTRCVRTFITRDESDLVRCHQSVAEALSYLHGECRLERGQIRIDFTGGTKAMSAAAVLAAAPDGYTFIYVGGETRNKNGLGTVVVGSERLIPNANPWSVLEEPELRSLLAYAGVGEWQAAIEVCRRLIDRADDASQPVFTTLESVLEGLMLWDAFDHKKALEGHQARNSEAVGSVPPCGSRRTQARRKLYSQMAEFRCLKRAFTPPVQFAARRRWATRIRTRRNTPKDSNLRLTINFVRLKWCKSRNGVDGPLGSER